MVNVLNRHKTHASFQKLTLKTVEILKFKQKYQQCSGWVLIYER